MSTQFFQKRQKRRNMVTLATVVTALIGFALVLLFQEKIHPVLAGSLTLGIGLVAGVLATVVHSSSDETKHLTFDRIINLVSGAEAAGLDRVELALQTGTKAEAACERAATSIHFIGVAGGKFLEKIINEKSPVGRKIASGEISVHLMLLDPEGNQVKAWTRDPAKLKKVQQDINKSLTKIRPCIKAKFHCRTYDFLPPLRILIIDENEVLVSRYDPSSETGWDAPQLCFSNRPSTHSAEFSKAFRNLYELLWASGKDVERQE